MKQLERNFWLDISLFVTFLSTACTGLLLWLHLTDQAAAIFLGFNHHSWLTAHICFGLASIAGSVTHIIWHRLWLKALRKRSIASLPAKLRTNRLMDRFVWIAFLATSLFGALSWTLPAYPNGVGIAGRLHVAFGLTMLLGIIVHVALHSKWIISATRRNFQVKKGDMVTMQPGGMKD
jgi:hypothetical protein